MVKSNLSEFSVASDSCSLEIKNISKSFGENNVIAPELTSIIQTIENSISTSVDAKNIVIEL